MESPSLKEEILAALAAAGCAPMHRLGQNFMINQDAVACLVKESGAGPGTRVVEIGPGTGVLTRRLMATGAQVLAIELDSGLHRHLETTLVPQGLVLAHGDCLQSKHQLHAAIEAWAAQGPWVLASNLPYDVSFPVILEAASLPTPPSRMVVTVQLEAAQRLCSTPGSDAWGASAAVLQAGGRSRIVRRLSPRCFHPAPRVDSAILVWEPESPTPPGFGAWCRSLFAYRRKVLPRALQDAGLAKDQALDACSAAGLDPSERVERLAVGELVALYRACA